MVYPVELLNSVRASLHKHSSRSAMKKIDQEPWRWLLCQEDNKYFLQALCSHSAVDYFFTIEMNSEELSHYEEEGREYLTTLAHDIHYSAPGVIGNKSIFRNRQVSDSIQKKI